MNCCDSNVVPLTCADAIKRGKSFSKQLRWATEHLIYRTITAVSLAAPCVLTTVGHGMPEGWPFVVREARGMTDLNLDPETGKVATGEEFYFATVLDADHVEINNLVSLGFKPYISGGVIQYKAPKDLAGYTAKLQFRKDYDSTDVLLELQSPTQIVLDNTLKTITFSLDESVTEDIAWDSAVYELLLTSPGGDVTQLVKGPVEVRAA